MVTNFIGPTEGQMACGEYGEGKMSSPKKYWIFKKYFEKRDFITKIKILKR